MSAYSKYDRSLRTKSGLNFVYGDRKVRIEHAVYVPSDENEAHQWPGIMKIKTESVGSLDRNSNRQQKCGGISSWFLVFRLLLLAVLRRIAALFRCFFSGTVKCFLGGPFQALFSAQMKSTILTKLPWFFRSDSVDGCFRSGK